MVPIKGFIKKENEKGGFVVKTPIQRIFDIEDNLNASRDETKGSVHSIFLYDRLKRYNNSNGKPGNLASLRGYLTFIKDLALTLNIPEDDIRESIAIDELRSRAVEYLKKEVEADSKVVESIMATAPSIEEGLNRVAKFKAHRKTRLTISAPMTLVV